MDVAQPSLLFEHLYADKIIPQTSRLLGLSLRYGLTAVSLGTQLEVADVSETPFVMLPASSRAGAVRSLLLLDADAPGPKAPTERSACLWAVTGLPATAGAVDACESTRVLLSFQRPDPPLGNHRLVVALLEHDDEKMAVPVPSRTKFALGAWAAASHATLTHANFFCVHARESWGSGGTSKKRKRKA